MNDPLTLLVRYAAALAAAIGLLGLLLLAVQLWIGPFLPAMPVGGCEVPPALGLAAAGWVAYVPLDHIERRRSSL